MPGADETPEVGATSGLSHNGATGSPAPGSGSARLLLVTWPAFPEGSGWDRRLADAGFVIRHAPKSGARTPEELADLIRDCTAAIVSTDPMPAEVFDQCERLRIVSRVGVGTDSIDLAAASRRGVLVTAARGSNEEAVADHTVGLMLAALRRVTEQDPSVRRGEWNRSGDALGTDLYGKTVGLIGLGTIATLVARRLAGFAVRILGCDPVATPPDGVRHVSMAELLAASDVVSVHVPLSVATRNLVDRRALGALKPGAVIVNTSRGGVVDEQALAEALAGGRLGGAGIDVFFDEPPLGSPLLTAPRTVLTPHIAGLSRDSVAAMVERATTAGLDWAAGVSPRGLVNPDVALSPRPNVRSSSATILSGGNAFHG
jgi:phosphoglycerate dehydrogenase-like enzyme